MSTYSKEHELFLKKIKRKKCLVYLTQLSIIIIFFLIWEILSRLHIINTFLFSSPSNIFKTITNLINTNNLLNHILVTSKEILISFILSFIIGSLLSILLNIYLKG